MKKYQNLIGQQFGAWIVINQGSLKLYKSHGKTYYHRSWLCECHCGFCNNIQREVIEQNLLSNTSKSCGRKAKVLNGKANKKQNKFEEYKDYYKIYCGEIYAIIDKSDFNKVIQFKWNLHTDSTNTYFRAYKGYRNDNTKEYIFLHNLILDNYKKDFVVDHINGNTLDNRKKNLRKCQQRKNEINKKIPKNNISGFKGVHYSKLENKWKSYITYNNKRYFLGTFNNKEDAIKIRKKAENKFFGEYNRGGINE